MKKVYVYALDTMADWELGYATAELNSGRYLKNKEWKVVVCAATKDPITTMGGMKVLPDVSIAEVTPDNASMLILPGADTWFEPLHAPLIEKVKALLKNDVPVAAICGATGALGEAGILDDKKHTSNGLPYLKMFCPHYKGEQNYQDKLVIVDGNLITAGSSAPVEFAYQIFEKLDAFEPKTLELWYGYFGKHSTEDMLKLLQTMQQ